MANMAIWRILSDVRLDICHKKRKCSGRYLMVTLNWKRSIPKLCQMGFLCCLILMCFYQAATMMVVDLKPPTCLVQSEHHDLLHWSYRVSMSMWIAWLHCKIINNYAKPNTTETTFLLTINVYYNLVISLHTAFCPWTSFIFTNLELGLKSLIIIALHWKRCPLTFVSKQPAWQKIPQKTTTQQMSVMVWMCITHMYSTFFQLCFFKLFYYILKLFFFKHVYKPHMFFRTHPQTSSLNITSLKLLFCFQTFILSGFVSNLVIRLFRCPNPCARWISCSSLGTLLFSLVPISHCWQEIRRKKSIQRPVKCTFGVAAREWKMCPQLQGYLINC